MAQAALPLTSLSEAQQAQAQERFEIIRPAWEKKMTQADVARTHQISLRTVQRWIKSYREQGLAGLADQERSDKGASRSLPQEAIRLIEGLAQQTPSRSVASIHRQITTIAGEQGWNPPQLWSCEPDYQGTHRGPDATCSARWHGFPEPSREGEDPGVFSRGRGADSGRPCRDGRSENDQLASEACQLG
jgi:transposase-like protein